MKRRRLRLYSYHTFLFVPFIVVFLYAHNPGEASFSMAWRTLLLGTAISVLLFACIYLLLRSRLKAGIFVTCFLFVSFQYGIVYEFLESLYYAGRWPLKNIHRYLAGLYLLIYVALFVALRFSRRDFVRANYFLNVLVLFLLLFNLSRVVFRSGTTVDRQGPAGGKAPEIKVHAADLPNMYHIVLDGYASASTLRAHYGYSNSVFLTGLAQLGFFIADSAFANYYYTDRSLNSTLNMQLTAGNSELLTSIADNRAMRILSSAGYKIATLQSGYAVTNNFAAADTIVTIAGPNEFEKSVLRHTILRLDDLVGIFARMRLQSQFKRMYSLLHSGDGYPRYAFMHFVAPHPPFVFDSTGKMRTRHGFAEHGWEPKQNYLGQLIHTSRVMLAFIRKIREKDPGAVIIVHSDHGPWVTADTADDVFRARADILYAVFSPQPLNIPRSTSCVNIFRYIFNGVLGSDLRLLPDEKPGKAALLADPILRKKVTGTSNSSEKK